VEVDLLHQVLVSNFLLDLLGLKLPNSQHLDLELMAFQRLRSLVVHFFVAERHVVGLHLRHLDFVSKCFFVDGPDSELSALVLETCHELTELLVHSFLQILLLLARSQPERGAGSPLNVHHLFS
jgi:hypothetical protein